jgi:RNA polymerase sigma-70 factor (ECF subfamily)
LDISSISQLWHENADYVLKLCVRYVKNEAVAEDIRQDVFLKIINSKESFKEQSAVKTWLYSITFHCCLDYFRLKKRQQSIIEEYSRIKTFYLNDSQSPVWEVKKTSKISCPLSQLFVELHFGEGWSREEISHVFGFSLTRVHKKMQIGIKQLQKIID